MMDESGMMFGNSLYWIFMFILGGTNVWTIILYILERKKRNLEYCSTQHDVDDKGFQILKNQLLFSAEQIAKYEEKLRTAEQLFDELRTEYLAMKTQSFELNIKLIEATNKLNICNELQCSAENCPNRKKRIL